MSLADMPFEQISETDLRALITDQVAEQRTLEYKRDLPGGSDKDKVELRADVSSFANAAGGYLIFGMEERKGVPIDLCGLEVADADSEILRLEQIVQSGVKPRVPGLASRAIALASGRIAIVIHIPRSWNGPHMAMNTADWGRFYARTSNGKYILDMGEMRAAVLRSETGAEHLRNFRAGRIASVAAGEMPVRLVQGAKLVLHVVPLNAFDPGVRFDVAALGEDTAYLQMLRPIGAGISDRRHNFDGYLTFGRHRQTYTPISYVQAFRNGSIEAVDTTTLCLRDGDHRIPSVAFEKYTLEALPNYLRVQQRLGVESPVVVMLSLVGVAGYEMVVEATFEDGHPIDRDILPIPEVLIESFDCAPDQVMKPCFDAVWNAAGWPRSRNYDADGRWKPRLH